MSPDIVSANVLSFAPDSATQFHLRFRSPGDQHTGFKFDFIHAVAAVPEPSSFLAFAMLGVVLSGWKWWNRPRR